MVHIVHVNASNLARNAVMEWKNASNFVKQLFSMRQPSSTVDGPFKVDLSTGKYMLHMWETRHVMLRSIWPAWVNQ